jgi:hypothetical protein
MIDLLQKRLENEAAANNEKLETIMTSLSTLEELSNQAKASSEEAKASAAAAAKASSEEAKASAAAAKEEVASFGESLNLYTIHCIRFTLSWMNEITKMM